MKAMAKSKCKCNMDSLGNEMSSNPKRCLYSMLYSLHQAIYNILRIHFSFRAAFRHRTNLHQYNINKCERAYRSMASLYFIFYKQYSIQYCTLYIKKRDNAIHIRYKERERERERSKGRYTCNIYKNNDNLLTIFTCTSSLKLCVYRF